MAADAEIVALNIYTNKTKAEEGGFKIAGGKVYYDNAGEYVELAGVNVAAGAKLLLKRVLNFAAQDAYTSSYFVYSADGKLLAQAKDIPMAEIKTPVQKVAFGVANIAGDAVVFDNFRMFTVDVHADFELYDAKTGMKQTDLEAARNSATAYRLSWQNASAYEKVYTVMAKFYNGTTLVEEKAIKEYKMAPGTDAIDFGIVEVGQGQSVVVYLRNDSQPEPDAQNPGTDKPSTDKPTEEPKKEGGCASALTIGAIASMILAGAWVTIAARKKD
jgi:hypothetical protein